MRRLLSRGEVVIAVWGLVLLVLWVVSWAFWHPDSETVILLGSAVAATLANAAWAMLRNRRVPPPGDREPVAVVGTTYATALAGIAIVCAVLGLEFGAWLLYLAAVLLLAALGGLARERRAARQVLEVAERAGRLEEGSRR